MNKDSWKWKTLGSISDIHDYKRKPITKKDRKIGIYPYYGATGIQDYIDNYIFDGSFVLVGEDGAKWGANENTAFLINGKFWVNNHAHVLQMHNDIFPKWVVYYLNHKDLNEFITGAVVPKLNQAALRSIPIPVPFISIQKQIVEELDTLSDIITKKKEQLAELDKLAQATFYDMFGDPVENEKQWKTEKLDTLCTKITDGEHFRPETTSEGIPFLSAKDILQEGISFKNTLFVTQETAKKALRRCNPEKNDILIVSRGATVGRMNMVKTDQVFCLLGSVILLKFKPNELSSYFLLQTLRNPDVLNKIRGLSSSSAQQALYLKDLKLLSIPVPPLFLQNQFAKKVEDIEQQKELINQSITNVQLLFDYTMDKYFN
ncbi:restriction endonuclease subunit S [Snodgrassella alvi]|uniref:restriction endonuclease subunit S n=1 Tax=Snodgrassella alvi TaxID=1196083 RepID=UPI00351C8DBF